MYHNRKSMNTKLTLKLNTEVIQQAKQYAVSQHRSLSSIVEDYLKVLTSQIDPNQETDEIEISPFVKSMATGVKISADIDVKTAYTDHLLEKYQ